TQAQTRVPHAAVGPGRFGLQPVEETEAELPGRVQVANPLRGVDRADRPEPVVVLRPVDHGDVTGGEAGLEVALVQNSSEAPPGVPILRLEEMAGERLA